MRLRIYILDLGFAVELALGLVLRLVDVRVRSFGVVTVRGRVRIVVTVRGRVRIKRMAGVAVTVIFALGDTQRRQITSTLPHLMHTKGWVSHASEPF